MICLPSRDTSPHDTRTARTQAPTQRQSRAGRRHSRPHHHRYGELDLYTIFVHSKADFLHTPIILLLPPSLSALLTLLHDYCAIYDAPPRTSLCMLYTIQCWWWEYCATAKQPPTPPPQTRGEHSPPPPGDCLYKILPIPILYGVWQTKRLLGGIVYCEHVVQ